MELKILNNKLKVVKLEPNETVPIEKAEKFADIVKGKKIIINNAGHFNEKYGYKEFREIMEYIN